MDEESRWRLGLLFYVLAFIAGGVALSWSSENPLWVSIAFLIWGAQFAIYGAQLTFTNYYYDLWQARGKNIKNPAWTQHPALKRLEEKFNSAMTEDDWRRHYRRVEGPGALIMGILLIYCAIRGLLELYPGIFNRFFL